MPKRCVFVVFLAFFSVACAYRGALEPGAQSLRARDRAVMETLKLICRGQRLARWQDAFMALQPEDMKLTVKCVAAMYWTDFGEDLGFTGARLADILQILGTDAAYDEILRIALYSKFTPDVRMALRALSYRMGVCFFPGFVRIHERTDMPSDIRANAKQLAAIASGGHSLQGIVDAIALEGDPWRANTPHERLKNYQRNIAKHVDLCYKQGVSLLLERETSRKALIAARLERGDKNAQLVPVPFGEPEPHVKRVLDELLNEQIKGKLSCRRKPLSARPSAQNAKRFNSKLHLSVWLLREDGDRKLIGHTPVVGGVEIILPRRGATWLVEPRYKAFASVLLVLGAQIKAKAVPALSLREKLLREADLAHLADATPLRRLDLAGNKVTDAGLAHLKRLTNLKELDLSHTRITGSGLVHLHGMSKLRSLDLHGTDRFRNANVRHLKTLTTLEQLDLSSTNITDAEVSHLKPLGNLRELELFNTKMSDSGLAELHFLTDLEFLNLAGTEITDAGLAHLKPLSKLRKLDLMDTQITDAGLAYLETLTNLEELDLSGTRITGSGLVHLHGMTNLRSLALAKADRFRNANLRHLATLTKLEELYLSGTNITDANLSHLKPLINLQLLNLSGTKITDAAVARLTGLSRLRNLYVADTKVSRKAMNVIEAKIPGLHVFANYPF